MDLGCGYDGFSQRTQADSVLIQEIFSDSRRFVSSVFCTMVAIHRHPRNRFLLESLGFRLDNRDHSIPLWEPDDFARVLVSLFPLPNACELLGTSGGRVSCGIRFLYGNGDDMALCYFGFIRRAEA